jgi:hypothetical protein
MAEPAACRDDADLTDRGVLVKTFWDAVDHGAPRLQSIPGLIKRILETGAWRRRVQNGRLYEHDRFLDFITAKPFAGCGYDPAQIEKLIEDDAEALLMWRRAVAQTPGKRTDLNDNIIEVKRQTGTSRAYTLDRLSRESPDLYDAVCRGEMSANRAAISAGFRKKPEPLHSIRKLLPELSLEDLDQLIEEAHEQRRRRT